MKFLIFWISVCLNDLVVSMNNSMSPFDLMSEYSRHHHVLQRPVSDPASSIDVRVNLNILNIEELDEPKQTMTINAWFYFLWTMENFSWNESNYQYISHVSVSPLDIWISDLVLGYTKNNHGNLAETKLPAVVHSNGLVDWTVLDQWKISCKVDVTKFPFDSQTCRFFFYQWHTFSWEVNYTFYDPPVTFVDFIENGEWNILNQRYFKSFTYNGSYQTLVFELVLGRKSAFYILTAVLSACVLSALNLLVFHVPPESGEKLTLYVSIFLSYAVYLTSIKSLLPSVSDNVALFSVYLNCMFVLKALTILSTVFVLSLQSVRPQTGLRSFLTKMLLHPAKIEARDIDVPTSSNTETVSHNRPDIDHGWAYVISRVDRILFYIFFLTFCISNIVFFILCLM